MSKLLAYALAGLATLAAADASAHSQSYGFLTVSIGKATLAGRIELAARDLDGAFDLDANRDGQVTWGEFRRREAELAQAVLDRIAIGDPQDPCQVAAEPALTDSRGGETYVVIPFGGSCDMSDGSLEIGYDLLFDIDAQHRGLVAVNWGEHAQSFVMSPEARRQPVDLRAGSDPGLFLTFVAHGAHHIWIGYDHILFVLTLLLGAVLSRQSGAWIPVRSPGAAGLAAAKVVTAFTAAHSLTLGLAATGAVRLAPSLAESAIAATIALAAINNVVPVVTRRLWLVAFLFGLVHGFGFANVLADLSLPRNGLLTALFAFNVGVEIGQLAIVALAVPLLFLASRRPIYERLVMPAASVLIAVVGVVWLLERTMGLVLLPAG